MELRWRVHRAFKAAREIAANLEQLENRRKSFIYLSSGYDFVPYQETRLRRSPAGQAFLDPETAEGVQGAFSYLPEAEGRTLSAAHVRQLQQLREPGSAFADEDLAALLADLAQAANRANASFYTIDPRGLVAAPEISYAVPLQEFQRYQRQTRSTMRLLADLTGGIAVVNTNNFGDALRRIDAETSDYYMLGFYSSNADTTLQTRRLRVEVNRPGAYATALTTRSQIPCTRATFSSTALTVPASVPVCL